MSPLAAAAAQHNAADDEQESQNERDDVAETGEGRRRVGGWREHGVDRSGGAPWQRFDEIAAAVDHRADPRRGRADHRNSLLGCPKARLGEVLRRTPASEPGVIGRVEDEARPVLLVDDMAREDDFVAELEANLAPFAAEID